MAKKRKQKKKIQRESLNRGETLSPSQLVSKGKERLEAGKARDAIEDFKLALKSGAAPDEAGGLLFRAYLLRSDQLHRKGMTVEAEVLMEQAKRFMPPVERMTGEHICACIASFPGDQAFQAYSRYAGAKGRDPEAEQLLAFRLLRDGCWESLALLEATLPLAKDAPHVKAALSPMNEGQWEAAVDLLRPLARSSPYVSLRLFCRSMAAFYRDDMAEMRKALALIPGDFPLAPVVRQMLAMASEDGQCPPSDTLDCLWEGPVGLEREVSGLVEALGKRRLADARQKIGWLSEKLNPSDPVAMRVAILKTISRLVADGRISPMGFDELAGRILPPGEAAFLSAQAAFMDHSDRSPAVAGRLINLLEHRFPDPKQKNIAHALILQETVRRIRRGEIRPERHMADISRYGKPLGVKSDDFQTILMEMTLKAISLDPEDRTGYEILVELPRHARGTKASVEKALTEMARLFPEDPYPCLELARVCSEKGAIRKAQDALEEAARRAPHDNRVVDRRVMAHLVSVQRNMKQKKTHLVAADLELAESLRSPATAVFVTEKRMLFEILFQRKNFHLIVDQRTGSLPLRDRLRILGLLALDIERFDYAFRSNTLKPLTRIIEKELDHLEDLASGDVARILMPLDRDLWDVYPFPSRAVTRVFSSGWKKLLKAVDDSDLPIVSDHIMGPDAYRLIDQEIGRRVENAEPRHSALMGFYRVAVRQIMAGFFDGKAFQEIADRTKGALLEEMRTIARRLSVHAQGPLKDALETFRFDSFVETMEDPDEDDDDYDWLLDDDDEEMEDDDAYDSSEFEDFINAGGTGPDGFFQATKKMIVNSVESMIDNAGLRGAPDRVVREFRGDFRAEPKFRKHFDTLAEIARKLEDGELSREARILLYGKR